MILQTYSTCRREQNGVEKKKKRLKKHGVEHKTAAKTEGAVLVHCENEDFHACFGTTEPDCSVFRRNQNGIQNRWRHLILVHPKKGIFLRVLAHSSVIPLFMSFSTSKPKRRPKQIDVSSSIMKMADSTACISFGMSTEQRRNQNGVDNKTASTPNWH